MKKHILLLIGTIFLVASCGEKPVPESAQLKDIADKLEKEQQPLLDELKTLRNSFKSEEEGSGLIKILKYAHIMTVKGIIERHKDEIKCIQSTIDNSSQNENLAYDKKFLELKKLQLKHFEEAYKVLESKYNDAEKKEIKDLFKKE